MNITKQYIADIMRNYLCLQKRNGANKKMDEFIVWFCSLVFHCKYILKLCFKTILVINTWFSPLWWKIFSWNCGVILFLTFSLLLKRPLLLVSELWKHWTVQSLQRRTLNQTPTYNEPLCQMQYRMIGHFLGTQVWT